MTLEEIKKTGDKKIILKYRTQCAKDSIKEYREQMCEATPEERESIDKYIKNISKPTGINFCDLDDNDDCISRKAVLSLLADHFDNVFDMVKELPSVAISPDHDGCKDCKYELKSDGKYPCSYCKQNYKDMWEIKKPTDTITMTREEFSEKLMEHYRQGREDGINNFIKKSLIDE